MYFCALIFKIHTMQNKTIYDYTLKHYLGQGGMAEVWYAENGLGKAAAIKILKEEYVKNKDVTDRFKNEASLMVKLDHPNIRGVYSYGTIDDRPCIVMAYLKGEDLFIRMEKGERFDPTQMKQWWNQLVDTLEYTRQEDIVHRDIKPSNLFLTDNGEIKLLDFGIAKIRDRINQTKHGTRLGSPMYMSPEQVKNSKDVDYRSDIYSLSVTFYHLLKGSAPYDDSIPEYAMSSIIVHQPLILKDIPAEWSAMLTPYLAKEPNDRPALKRFEQKHPSPPKPKKKVKNMVFASLAGVLAALGFCVFYFDMLKSPEQAAYEKAIQTASPEIYEAYLLEYPNSVHFNEIDRLYENLIYDKGDSLYLAKNYDEAAIWLHKSAERDNTSALLRLGFMYRNSLGVPQNDKTAFDLYQKAADLGDPEGQNSLGFMYRQNVAVPRNDSIAVIWFRKSAEQNYAPGQANLGFMYKVGYGVPRDCNEAVKWLSKAAEKKHADALYRLGDIYEYGCNDIPKNLTEAFRLYNEAAYQGHQGAKDRLSKLQISKNE